MASAGDILTQEALAAVAIPREKLPELKIRFVNVVDLYRLQPDTEHPHGLPDRDFDSLFTKDKPVIFNFHGYPWLIHEFTYRRTNHANIHVRGYKEKGNINTPLELAIRNQVDRFNLAIDAIDRVPRLAGAGAHLKEWLKGQIIESVQYADTEGVDKKEIREWKWAGGCRGLGGGLAVGVVRVRPAMLFAEGREFGCFPDRRITGVSGCWTKKLLSTASGVF